MLTRIVSDSDGASSVIILALLSFMRRICAITDSKGGCGTIRSAALASANPEP